MYILYKHDGSVRFANLTDFVQKGNNNVNSIFLAIDGYTNTEWSASVIFTLPSQEKVALTPQRATLEINGVTYSGWLVNIPSDVTIYEGIDTFSITAFNLSNQILFTYRSKLTINPSVVDPDQTTITYAQYQSLLQYVQSIEQELNDRIDELEDAISQEESQEEDV